MHLSDITAHSFYFNKRVDYLFGFFFHERFYKDGIHTTMDTLLLIVFIDMGCQGNNRHRVFRVFLAAVSLGGFLTIDPWKADIHKNKIVYIRFGQFDGQFTVFSHIHITTQSREHHSDYMCGQRIVFDH